MSRSDSATIGGAPPKVGRWRLSSLVSLHLRHWNEEWAVFDAGSGQTHLVDTLTAMSLMVLESGASSRADIEEHVAKTFELTDATDVSCRLDDIIVNLCQLGLVEPVPH